jgi:hypothetical protein
MIFLRSCCEIEVYSCSSIKQRGQKHISNQKQGAATSGNLRQLSCCDNATNSDLFDRMHYFLICESVMMHNTDDDVPHYQRESVTHAEVFTALVTGTRPVYFQTDEESPLWGGGTMFIAQWKDKQFAITARHVFTNCDASPQHTRILFPGFKIALPIIGMYAPSFPGNEAQQDLEDMTCLLIRKEFELDEDMHWYAWNMERFWRPATDLQIGQQIFAVGFPNTDDRYDWENQRVNEMPVISVGMLGIDSLGPGTYCIDTAEFEYNIDGCSGGPVFARFDGFFHYVGLIIRGGSKARKIYFVGAEYVTWMLDNSGPN